MDQAQFDIVKAYRFFGYIMVDTWLNTPFYTDDLDPLWNKDLSYLDTPEKRKDFTHQQKSITNQGLRRTGSVAGFLHINYVYAGIEDWIRLIEFKNRKRWTIIRSVMKLLSLHQRAVVSANHPNAKMLRGEFEL